MEFYNKFSILIFMLLIKYCSLTCHNHNSTSVDSNEVSNKTLILSKEEVSKSNTTTSRSDAPSHKKKLLCYYGSWAVYRPGNGKFPVENIDPYLCTHLIYAFAGLSYDNKIKSLDPYYDLEENYGKGAFKRFNNLKKINSNLKTLIAIGGWNEGSIKYSNLVAQPEARKTFVQSVVEFIEKYDFDGLDLDWEYPAARGGKPEDKNNYILLLRELKEAFVSRGYLLTAAVSAGKWFIDPAYDIPEVSKYLDIINVMCYDYHGGWENKTGHNAPMYPRPEETDADRISNVNFSINYWLAKGASKEKIVLGMGTYGRSFTLQKTVENRLGAFAPQTGQAGPYTREAGSLGYNEICEMRMNENWEMVRDPYHMAPYIFRDRQWVGFDDIESITIKAQYIQAMNLAGGMIWSVETDDFLGRCHNEKYPLLKTINRVFEREVPNIPTPNPKVTDQPTPTSPITSSTTKSWSWERPTSKVTESSTLTTTTTTTSTSTSFSSTRHTEETTKRPPESSTTERRISTSTSKTPWPWAPTHPWASPSSTSSSTSSPSASSEKPIESADGEFVCHSAGMHRHQNNCQKFYQCVHSNTEGKFRKYEYTCPDETVFDTNTKSCTWPQNVPGCSKKNWVFQVYKANYLNLNFSNLFE